VCLCDEGWTKDGSNPARCVIDKDECTEGQRCFPGVQCINVPGSFHCGPCPRGEPGLLLLPLPQLLLSMVAARIRADLTALRCGLLSTGISSFGAATHSGRFANGQRLSNL